MKPTKGSERLDEAIGHIDDSLIEEAYAREADGAVPLRWRKGRLLAAAACLIAVLICGGIYMGTRSGDDVTASGQIELSSHSQRVTATYISSIPTSEVEAGAAGAIAWHTEDEEFDHIVRELDAAIFRGTVLRVDGVKLISDDGTTDYRSIVELRVDEPIRGTCEAGETVRVVSPVPLQDDYGVEDTDVLELLHEGVEGIFMPVPYGEDDVEKLGTGKLLMRDLAPYTFPNGICYAIVEDAGSLVHCDSMTGLKDARTLDEAVDYVKRMIAAHES